MVTREFIIRNPIKPPDGYRHIYLRLPGGDLYYRFRRDERTPAMRFVQEGIGGFLRGEMRPIFVPPPADDENMFTRNHFESLAEEVFHRAYVVLLGRQEVYPSPSLLLGDPDATVPNYLEELNVHFGRPMRIIPPDAITKHWGGRLDEFDQLMGHDGKRYRRRHIIASHTNDNIYRSGIPLSRYLELLESHPPEPDMSYEDYFQELRRKSRTGDITPSPWPPEDLFTEQPRLF